jgi:hypothetical protein
VRPHPDGGGDPGSIDRARNRDVACQGRLRYREPGCGREKDEGSMASYMPPCRCKNSPKRHESPEPRTVKVAVMKRRCDRYVCNDIGTGDHVHATPVLGLLLLLWGNPAAEPWIMRPKRILWIAHAPRQGGPSQSHSRSHLAEPGKHVVAGCKVSIARLKTSSPQSFWATM